MYIDGDVLEIDIEMDLEEVKALKEFIVDRFAYVEEIVLQSSKEENMPTTSALFALLYWIKCQKPSIKIDFIESKNLNLGTFGMMHWISHE